jgi:hypothetical protein
VTTAPGQVDRVQQRLDLGDFGCGVRDAQLRDDHGLLVQHRREQLHVALGVAGAGTPHALAVHRQAPPPLRNDIISTTIGASCPLGDPLAYQQVGGVNVDVFGHPAQRGTTRGCQLAGPWGTAGAGRFQQRGR